ncbi:TDT family transporter [Tissierella sp. MSJ-40]|uniref:TDT family transporter n=1 Tax=Tissierella simiarum TaxID=2841534 RepID=A0ABS6E153_9FIRM|nr:TDT family transporter [Tissierella simiarum]MBU5436571.1 TDT family transporter [Tissierella simiarum]
MDKSFLERLENMPVPVLPTMVGTLTLSNVYQGLGFSWIRHVFMCLGTCIWIFYLIKILKYPKTFKKEYTTTVSSSLYPGFTMIMMILGSYYIEFNQVFGKSLWIIGLSLHAIHILVFTYRNLLSNFNINTFLPSWFVTYNGIMVSAVVGKAMNESFICKIITYYGITVYLLLIPFMIYRLIKVEIKAPVYHTMAILLAPCSLCLVSYLNNIDNPSLYLVFGLYFAVISSLAFVICKLPKFFSFDFTPGYAGMTFPMAIGIVASIQVYKFVGGLGYEKLSIAIKQLSGFQIYITTTIIGYVLIQFLIMFLKSREQINKKMESI